VFLLPPTGVLFTTAIAVNKCNIVFFSTEAVGSALTVQVALRDSYAYNSSGQASWELLLGYWHDGNREACWSSVQSMRDMGNPGNAATSPTLQFGVKPKRYVAGKQKVHRFLCILYVGWSSVQSLRDVGNPGNAATSPTLQFGVKPKRYVAGKQKVRRFLYILYVDSYPADGSSRFPWIVVNFYPSTRCHMQVDTVCTVAPVKQPRT
jgi:hypothetical protein